MLTLLRFGRSNVTLLRAVHPPKTLLPGMLVNFVDIIVTFVREAQFENTAVENVVKLEFSLFITSSSMPALLKHDPDDEKLLTLLRTKLP